MYPEHVWQITLDQIGNARLDAQILGKAVDI
jgi:hypothetical protein